MNACGKRRYRDELAAMLALGKTRRSRSKTRAEVRAYRCPTCKGWHITSKPLTTNNRRNHQ